MKEKGIERASVKLAVKAGWVTYKFASPAHRGVPDRIFIKGGVIVFIEFKTPTGRVSALQEREMAVMRAHGANVYVCRSVERCMEVLATLDPDRNEKVSG